MHAVAEYALALAVGVLVIWNIRLQLEMHAADKVVADLRKAVYDRASLQQLEWAERRHMALDRAFDALLKTLSMSVIERKAEILVVTKGGPESE